MRRRTLPGPLIAVNRVTKVCRAVAVSLWLLLERTGCVRRHPMPGVPPGPGYCHAPRGRSVRARDGRTRGTVSAFHSHGCWGVSPLIGARRLAATVGGGTYYRTRSPRVGRSTMPRPPRPGSLAPGLSGVHHLRPRLTPGRTTKPPAHSSGDSSVGRPTGFRPVKSQTPRPYLIRAPGSVAWHLSPSDRTVPTAGASRVAG